MAAPLLRPLDFPITGTGPLSRAARARGHASFADVAEEVRALPYGRVRDSEKIAAIFDEGMGTCSSKHRYLAALAHENDHPEIVLTLGLYEMSQENTPGVGAVLTAEGLAAVPEAHCYLKRSGERHDYTGVPPGSRSPWETLIEEQAISPDELPKMKARYHRAALAAWARAHGLNPERVWAIRERCIEALSRRAPAKRSR